MTRLPTGTVTFLFADVEGSTRRLEQSGVETGRQLAWLLDTIRGVVEVNQGVVFETVGDAAYGAFGRARDAVAAAAGIHPALAAFEGNRHDAMSVRIGVHTGEVESRGRHYFGPALFRCARLQALGWGGQTLISSVTARLVEGSLPDGHRLVDRGIQQLKDLAEPEQVYELAGPYSPSFPPLRVHEGHSTNLPEQLPRLIGRDPDATAVRDLLRAGRLVTITGPAGTGKTSLALQVASRLLDENADGVWFVDLAPVREPELVPAAVAVAIGLREQPSVPLIETLTAYFRQRQTLLVLDNFEQVSDAAGTVARLLDATGLRVIATSREPLRLRDEKEYSLSPLGLIRGPNAASVDAVEAVPSVQLFVDRVRDVVPSFELTPANAGTVAAICARLDGLPLAIELAAPLMRLLTAQQLLERLGAQLDLLTSRTRDLPERQRTLRAALSWSYELLSEEEKRAFRGLAVFADGFTLSAAEEVLTDLDVDVVDAVGSLLDKSLLVRDPDASADMRFRMLETVREYALEQLGGSADDKGLWHAVSAWALKLVTKDGHAVRWSDALPTVAVFRAERNNVLGAIRWLDQAGSREEFVTLVAAASSLWLAADMKTEGRPWIRAAVDLDPPPSPWTGRLLRNAGSIEHELGNTARGVELTRRSAEIWASLGNDRERADALRRLGATLSDRGSVEEAREVMSEAVSLARSSDDQATLRAALADLAGMALVSGDLDQADGLLAQLLEACTRARDQFGIGMAHGNRSYAHLLRNRLADAEADAREAVRIFAALDRGEELGWANQNLAGILTEAGRTEEASELARRGLELSWRHEAVRDIAAGLDVIAVIAQDEGDPRRALRLAMAAERLRVRAELSIGGFDKERVDRTMEAVRTALGAEFDALEGAVQAESIDEIVAEELGIPGSLVN
jgi:predicted ATPase/class 3 adenylate cyclase